MVVEVIVGPALAMVWVLGMTGAVDMGFPAVAIVVVLDLAVCTVGLVQLVFAVQVVAITLFPLALVVMGVWVLDAIVELVLWVAMVFLVVVGSGRNEGQQSEENNNLEIDQIIQ
jgi:hypothetical protein